MQANGLKEIPMAVTKVTIVDSPEKMCTQSSGYSIIIPRVKERTPYSEEINFKKKPVLSGKKSDSFSNF